MKNTIEIQTRLREILNKWSYNQGLDYFTRHYLYFLKSEPGKPGDIIITASHKEPEGYVLARQDCIDRSKSVQYLFNYYSKIINQLPVLEIPETNPDTVKIAIDCGHNVKSVDSIVYPDGSEGQLNFNIYLI